MEITGTISFPELFWETLALIGVGVCWSLAGRCRDDLLRWHGSVIWRSVLATRLRNARIRLASTEIFVLVGAVFMVYPEPILTQVRQAVAIAGSLLLVLMSMIVLGSVLDYLDRRFIVRAGDSEVEFSWRDHDRFPHDDVALQHGREGGGGEG